MFGVRRKIVAFAAAACCLTALLAPWSPDALAEDSDGPEEQAPAALSPGMKGPPGSASAIKVSGLPVPRFVSIRSNEINARTGPSTQYPIQWVFSRRGMPMEVTAEFDTWRRIRDREGADGWVMQGMLSPKRSVLIIGVIRTLHREPVLSSRAVARVEPGVVAPLLHVKDDWCEVDAGGYRGWLKCSEVWGVYPGERLE
ncbi:MAG: SH3 domain-containing protein [Rhodospirillaceae bacterium]